MPDNHIHLTLTEVYEAATMGVKRQVSNLRHKRQHAYGGPAHRAWQMHVDGCIGELVVARRLGREWTGNFEMLDADDVDSYQVRTTHYSHGKLFIHPKDPDDRIFVLVTGVDLDWVVRGWILGSEAKSIAPWGEPEPGRPCWCVTQDMLHDIDSLDLPH